jgi:type IV pilus assembly protein PilC
VPIVHERSKSSPAARRTRAHARPAQRRSATDIESGSTLYEALAGIPLQFDELYRNLVKAGEGAGVLDTVLDTLATYKENIEALKGKIKKAMFYPAMVIAVAVLVSAILLIFVMPQFEEVFSNFGAELPAFTMMSSTSALHGRLVVG